VAQRARRDRSHVDARSIDVIAPPAVAALRGEQVAQRLADDRGIRAAGGAERIEREGGVERSALIPRRLAEPAIGPLRGDQRRHEVARRDAGFDARQDAPREVLGVRVGLGFDERSARRGDGDASGLER